MWATTPNQLLRYENGAQKRLRRISNRIYFRIGTNLEEVETGYPIECRPVGIGYKHIPRATDCHDLIVPMGNFESDNKAINKTLGFVQCMDFRQLEKKWKAGESWNVSTDGEPQGGIGTCGVSFHCSSLDEELLYSMSAESCVHQQLHSTREELRAVVAAEAMIQICNEMFGFVPQRCHFVCDNKSALAGVKGNSVRERSLRKKDPMAPESDLLWELSKLRKK